MRVRKGVWTLGLPLEKKLENQMHQLSDVKRVRHSGVLHLDVHCTIKHENKSMVGVIFRKKVIKLLKA
jgi:hypothetical protein